MEYLWDICEDGCAVDLILFHVLIRKAKFPLDHYFYVSYDL